MDSVPTNRHFVFCFLAILSILLFFPRFSRAERLRPNYPSILKSYPIQGVNAVGIKRVLDSSGQSEAEVDLNQNTNTLLIWGTAAAHREIHTKLLGMHCLADPQSNIRSAAYTQVSGKRQPIQLIAGQNEAPLPLLQHLPQSHTPQNLPQNLPQFSAPAIPQTPQQTPQQTPRQMRSVILRNLSASDFEKKLIDNLGRRFINVSPFSATTETVQYQLPLAAGQVIDIVIDRRQNSVIVSGTGRSVDSFVQVIALMDSDINNPNIATELVPYSPSNTKAVNDAIRAIGKTSQVAYQQESPPTSHENKTPTIPKREGTEIAIRQGTPPSAQTQIQPGTQGFTIPGGAGLVGPVTVEILDDGIVVVRGNENDVKIVKEMLQHLETISMEHEPQVLVRPMIHADCSRIATMLRQLYNEIYQTRKGNISITALIKPNAILFIGYEGSIEAALELLGKLDVAVDAETEYRVFRLQYASAATLQTSIEGFYADRTGLGAAVVVASDVRTNALVIQASPRDMVEITALVAKLDVGTSGAVSDMKVIPLMNTLASELAPIVQQAVTGRTTTQGFGANTASTSERSSVLSFQTIDTGTNRVIQSDVFTDVRITADTRGNNIIVVAPGKCLPLIEALVRQLDAAPKAVAQIKVFTIVNSDAQTLLTMLNTLFSTTSQTTTAQPAVRTGAGDGESSLIPVRFAVDSRTNSIIASGSEGDLNIVEAILIRLDERDLQNRRVMVYRLLNTPSTDVATALNDYLNNESSLRQSTEVLIGDVDRFRSEVVVTDEPKTNSLIISTTPRYYEQMKKIIDQLDERPPLVSIAVLIAEVTLSNAHELGFELGLQDSILFDRGTLGDVMYQTTTQQTPGGQVQTQEIISSTKNPGFNFADPSLGLGNNAAGSSTGNVGSQGITNFALGRTGELGYSGFLFSASSESVSVLIRALEERKKLTVLHKPTLTTLHNEESFLQVGQKVQRVMSLSNNESGGQNTEMNEEELGVILKITPRVSADGRVVLQIDASKSTLGSAADGVPIGIGANGQSVMSPNINITQVQTTVSASSGQTIVLGGLTNEETTVVHRAVPWISQIPVLGQLFQYNLNQCSRKEVLFIMTPRILRSDEEIQAMTQLESSRIAWCASHVSSMMGDETIKTRTDDWTSAETRVERGEAYKPEDQQLMPSEEIIDRSTIQNLPLPQIAPVRK